MAAVRVVLLKTRKNIIRNNYIHGLVLLRFVIGFIFSSADESGMSCYLILLAFLLLC